MADKNIQEAEVGSGTKVADTKQSEKRAQLTLKAIQLRMKQEKERAALQQQKKSLSVKEETMKKEEVEQIEEDEEMTQKKKEQVVTVKHKDSGKELRIVKTAVADYQKRGYHPVKEELSPKQKAMDKNKNGKIDGFDLAHLRKKTEELSPAQKAIDKNKNNKIDATDLAHLRSKKKLPQGADFAAQRRKERLASSGRMDEEVKVGDKVSFNHPMTAAPGKTMKKVGTVHKVEDDTVHVKVKSKYGVMTHKKSASELTKEEFAIGEESINEKSDYETYHKDYSSAVQTAIKQAEKRGFEVDMNDWDDKVATGPKKPSAGKTNSFSINLMKDGKPSKKKLQMQVYNMDNQKYELNMYIEEVDQDAYVGKSVAESIMDKINEVISGKSSINEKTDYEVYHKDYSGAVQTAIKQAEKRGFEVDMDDWHDKVATGPKKPSAGKTNSFSVNLMKDGKPSKKKLQMQVYNMDNQKYELNMYIEEIQLDELNKDTLYSYAKKSEKDQDDQYNKVGKGIRDKDPKSANKAGHKFSMRSIGQNRAEKRLAKEGVVDKIKAIKRGLEARAKASDHFDKAMDTKSPDASKHLKKAVRYHNLLNKEETEIVTEAKKKSFKDVKKKMKEEEMPSKATIKKGDVLTGKREPIEINPELKEPSR